MSAKTSIIIIEDEKHICNFMATTLTAQGYKISTAANAKTGLSLGARILSYWIWVFLILMELM